nr:hypothetical protein HmN_000624500 [Hymenolepis microstoma]
MTLRTADPAIWTANVCTTTISPPFSALGVGRQLEPQVPRLHSATRHIDVNSSSQSPAKMAMGECNAPCFHYMCLKYTEQLVAYSRLFQRFLTNLPRDSAEPSFRPQKTLFQPSTHHLPPPPQSRGVVRK